MAISRELIDIREKYDIPSVQEDAATPPPREIGWRERREWSLPYPSLSNEMEDEWNRCSKKTEKVMRIQDMHFTSLSFFLQGRKGVLCHREFQLSRTDNRWMHS